MSILKFLLFYVLFFYLYPKGNKRERIAILIAFFVVTIIAIFYYFDL